MFFSASAKTSAIAEYIAEVIEFFLFNAVDGDGQHALLEMAQYFCHKLVFLCFK